MRVLRYFTLLVNFSFDCSAVIRVNYAMAYIQILLVQLDGRHPGDMDILLRILNTAKQKRQVLPLASRLSNYS